MGFYQQRSYSDQNPNGCLLPNMNDIYRYVEIICYSSRAFENSFAKTVQIIWATGLEKECLTRCQNACTLFLKHDDLLFDLGVCNLGLTLDLWDSGFSSVKWGSIFLD